MGSSRSKKALGWHAILIVAAVVAWRCASAPKAGPETDVADHGSFDLEHKNMRAHLNRKTGSSGVVIDENTILIGLAPNSNGDANFTYLPSEMRVQRGKTPKLQWVCWDGPFTLTLKDGGESPLERNQPVVTGGATLPSAATAKVRGDAPAGSYHFIVHIELPDGGTADDPDCPPIIIE
jgi:hypothetical protein